MPVITPSDRIRALLDRLTRKVSTVVEPEQPDSIREEVNGKLKEIADLKVEGALGERVDNWLAHPFTKPFLEFLLLQVDGRFEELRKGKMDWSAYDAFHTAIENAEAYPITLSARGRTARETLETWRKDGTLEEAEAYLSAER